MAKTKESAKSDNAKKGKKSQDQGNAVQNFAQFSKDSWAEFQKIQWPTPRQAMIESFVVLLTVIFVIALVQFYDMISGFIVGLLLQK